MTKQEASLQVIESILLNDRIHGFTVKEVLLLQKALIDLKAKESPEPSLPQPQGQ